MADQNILDYLQENGKLDQAFALQADARKWKNIIRSMWDTEKEGSEEYTAAVAKHNQIREQGLNELRDYFVAIDDRVALSVLYVNDMAHFSAREQAARRRISKALDAIQKAYDEALKAADGKRE